MSFSFACYPSGLTVHTTAPEKCSAKKLHLLCSVGLKTVRFRGQVSDAILCGRQLAAQVVQLAVTLVARLLCRGQLGGELFGLRFATGRRRQPRS